MSNELSRRQVLAGATLGVPSGKRSARTRRSKSTKVNAKVPPPSARNLLVVIDGGPGGRLHATFGPGTPSIDDGSRGDYFVFNFLIKSLMAKLPKQWTVTRAHRDVDPHDWASLSDVDRRLYAPNIERFRFDAIDLATFDAIWLIGVGSVPETVSLAETESLAIAQFMDAGGGIFATGDHGDIGQPMCGRIPRVRSMRAWFTKDPPDNEPMSPDPIAAERNDTTRPGPGEDALSTNFQFSNQSDDSPAPITFTAEGNRHELFDLGMGRRLVAFPDHMHEGEVIDPFDPRHHMSPTLTYVGHAITEYPLAHDGSRPSPVILALGSVLGGHSTISTETIHVGSSVPTRPENRLFGTVCAYDGRPLGLGRVVVTSTFHQLADINLIGDPRALTPSGQPDPLRRVGFTASPKGRQLLEDLGVFWANIARWIARP